MTEPNPSICVDVDVTNPGQFFACCGLLELADRLWPGAEGWFEGAHFHIATNGTLLALLELLVKCQPEEMTTLKNGISAKPLIAPLMISIVESQASGLVLDAWMTIRIEKGEAAAVADPPWNFWSGQQTPLRIWRALRNALARQLRVMTSKEMESLWGQRILLSGRFGFDPGAAWTALDVGFSPNEQSIHVASSPAVELFAAIGIQRFRPKLAPDRQSFVYATWGIPLTPSVAATAVSSIVAFPPMCRFRGRVISRGSYAALGHSVPIAGEDHD